VRPAEGGAPVRVTTAEEQFTEFATLAAARLRRTAFLLCGDWHTAEDLAQTALAKVFVSWRRISHKDAAQAYATRTLVNSYLALRRRKRVAEVLLSRLPERAAPSQTPELRLVMLDADQRRDRHPGPTDQDRPRSL